MQSITKMKLVAASIYGLAALIATYFVIPFFAFLTTPIAATLGYFFGYNPEKKKLLPVMFSGFLITLGSAVIFDFLFAIILLSMKLYETCPKIGFACLLNILEFFYTFFMTAMFTFFIAGLIIFPAGILAALLLHFFLKLKTFF